MPFVIYAMTSPTSGNGVALCVAPLAVLIPHGTVGQLMDLVTAVSTRPPALLHGDGTILVHSGFDWFGGGDDLGHAGGHHECDDARLTDRGTGIGLWLSTVPAGCSLACSIVRMDRFSPLTSLRASSMVLPVRLGTWLSLLTSERLTYRMTVESPSTVSPAAGWV